MDVRAVSRRALLYGAPVAAGGALLAQGAPASAVVVSGAGASPLDYGAVGDGVADDTAAINACLAANRAVDLGGPQYTYRITATLLVVQSSAQTVTGCGASVRADAGEVMMRLKNAGHTVAGIRFDGNDRGTRGVIVEGTAPGSRVEGCAFTAVTGTGVEVQQGAQRTRITACTFERCGRGSGIPGPFNTTIYVAGADHCSVVDNDLRDCDWGIYFRAPDAATGINFYECRGNRIVCASPAPAASQGISNGHGRNARIEHNTVIGFADNSIDCFGCRNIAIIGNSTQGGKDAVFVGDDSTNSITISANTFSGPQRGVRVLRDNTTPDARGTLVTGVVISANTVSHPTQGAILVQEGGTAQVSGVTIADNDLHLADTGLYGVKIINAEVSRISGNRIYRPRNEGILLDGADIIEVTGNTLHDAGRATPNGYDAISVRNSNRILIRDTIAYGTARYAVAIPTGAGMTVTGTRWRSMGTGGVNIGAPGAVQSDNLAF
jgi:nitrous oxidase accessory protein NosD